MLQPVAEGIPQEFATHDAAAECQWMEELRSLEQRHEVDKVEWREQLQGVGECSDRSTSRGGGSYHSVGRILQGICYSDESEDACIRDAYSSRDRQQ